ncbi:MAG: 50S ribosomal protein L10 [Planctomycetota bacterium]|jgi:large subunit ribosomal protein L10
MSKEIKHMMAESVRGDLESSENLLVMGLLPMDAEATVALRTELREQGAKLRVIHNRTTRYALDDARKPLADLFVGQTAIAVAQREETDFIGIAKTLVAAALKKKLEVRGGYVDGEVLDKTGFEELSRCPDKPTLRAMLCGARRRHRHGALHR